jgi:hypothetical protein
MKKTRNLKAILFITLMVLPALAFAQASAVISGLGQVGTIITALTQNVVRAISTLFATAAMVVFFYGVVQYIWGIRSGDESKIKDGNKFLRWGLVALFVMFSVWGIVIYVQRIFGIENYNTIVIPQIQLQNGSSTTSTTNPLNGNTGGNTGNTGNGGATTGFCVGKADGTTCTLPSGANGTCGNSEEGARGCYATPGGGGGGGQTTYYCDNGTPYYNLSDRSVTCGGTSNNCLGITDGSTCQQMGCSWSNSELSCSP